MCLLALPGNNWYIMVKDTLMQVISLKLLYTEKGKKLLNIRYIIYVYKRHIYQTSSKFFSLSKKRTLKYILGRFRQYDYGDTDKNLRIYNSTTPPDYQLEKITAPIVLFSSDNDWLATTKVYLKIKKIFFLQKLNLICRNKLCNYLFFSPKCILI